MDETPGAADGILSTLKRLLKALLDVVENRAELFLIELKEERQRLFDGLLLAAIGVVCALMTLVMVTLTIVVIFWDTHRVLVLALLTAVYAGAAVTTFLALRARLRAWRAFSTTLEEIRKDRACFKKPK